MITINGVKVKSLSCVQLFAIPWTAAYQAPPSMGFSRQEYWSGVPSPSPDSSVGTKSACNAGDPSSILGLGRSAGEVKNLPPPVIWPRELVHGVSSQKVRQD